MFLISVRWTSSRCRCWTGCSSTWPWRPCPATSSSRESRCSSWSRPPTLPTTTSGESHNERFISSLLVRLAKWRAQTWAVVTIFLVGCSTSLALFPGVLALALHQDDLPSPSLCILTHQDISLAAAHWEEVPPGPGRNTSLTGAASQEGADYRSKCILSTSNWLGRALVSIWYFVTGRFFLNFDLLVIVPRSQWSLSGIKTVLTMESKWPY